MSDESIDESGSPPQGPSAPHPVPDEDWWLDRPSSITLIIRILIVAGVGVVLADVFHVYHKHGDFDFQAWWGFDAAFGFAAYCFLIVSAKGWRKIVMRGEDYYD